MKCAGAVENKKPLSVALIDIDYFKQFNDRFGHLAGDCALNLVDEVIQQSIRRPGIVLRAMAGRNSL
ncbi:diguanylate cyclase [Ochrobactrum haematophilum]|uniref:diguanylate cyclase n=1 Tax=Brucella haematophila TaxID=419474 RepID=A0ABX1DR44_9HYPH|nr:diguanylate cyclase [Brucella haematophila]